MATFAEQMVEKLQAILLANAGLASVSVDGTMVAQSRDIHRNFTIAGWMIRKHLD